MTYVFVLVGESCAYQYAHGVRSDNFGQENGHTVHCAFVDDSSWILIQGRYSGKVNFHKTWEEYKEGFGSVGGELWIGNDLLHELTGRGKWRLRVELKDRDQVRAHGVYMGFKVANENQRYKLSFDRFENGSSIGDGLSGDILFPNSSSNNAAFSTHDTDNDALPGYHCAAMFGAWWWNDCVVSKPFVILNSAYSRTIVPPPGNGLLWTLWRGDTHSLLETRLLIQEIGNTGSTKKP